MTGNAYQPSFELPYIFDLIWDLKSKDDLAQALESPGCDPDLVDTAIEYGYVSRSYSGNSPSPAEEACLKKLRARGFAVIVIPPDQLRGRDPEAAEAKALSSLLLT